MYKIKYKIEKFDKSIIEDELIVSNADAKEGVEKEAFNFIREVLADSYNCSSADERIFNNISSISLKVVEVTTQNKVEVDLDDITLKLFEYMEAANNIVCLPYVGEDKAVATVMFDTKNETDVMFIQATPQLLSLDSKYKFVLYKTTGEETNLEVVYLVYIND